MPGFSPCCMKSLAYYSFCLEYSFSHCPSTLHLHAAFSEMSFLPASPHTSCSTWHFCSCIDQYWCDYLMSPFLWMKGPEGRTVLVLSTPNSALWQFWCVPSIPCLCSVQGCLPYILVLLKITFGSWKGSPLWTLNFTSSVVLTRKMTIWWTPISVIILFPGSNFSSNCSKALRHYK